MGVAVTATCVSGYSKEVEVAKGTERMMAIDKWLVTVRKLFRGQAVEKAEFDKHRPKQLLPADKHRGVLGEMVARGVAKKFFALQPDGRLLVDDPHHIRGVDPAQVVGQSQRRLQAQAVPIVSVVGVDPIPPSDSALVSTTTAVEEVVDNLQVDRRELAARALAYGREFLGTKSGTALSLFAIYVAFGEEEFGPTEVFHAVGSLSHKNMDSLTVAIGQSAKKPEFPVRKLDGRGRYQILDASAEWKSAREQVLGYKVEAAAETRAEDIPLPVVAVLTNLPQKWLDRAVALYRRSGGRDFGALDGCYGDMNKNARLVLRTELIRGGYLQASGEKSSQRCTWLQRAHEEFAHASQSDATVVSDSVEASGAEDSAEGITERLPSPFEVLGVVAKIIPLGEELKDRELLVDLADRTGGSITRAELGVVMLDLISRGWVKKRQDGTNIVLVISDAGWEQLGISPTPPVPEASAVDELVTGSDIAPVEPDGESVVAPVQPEQSPAEPLQIGSLQSEAPPVVVVPEESLQDILLMALYESNLKLALNAAGFHEKTHGRVFIALGQKL